jgi:hypothetical protein
MDPQRDLAGADSELLSPKEKAYMMANWFRVMMLAGYNPFFGKTMSRRSAHSVTGGKDTIMQRFGLLRRDFLNQYAPEFTSFISRCSGVASLCSTIPLMPFSVRTILP